MNKVILMGRLTRDPEVRYSNNDPQKAMARYTLAVDRRIRRDGENTADFLNCVAFGRSAEFAEKYLHKGTKILVVGRIQTGSYTNRDGQKVNTVDIVVEEQEFAESRNAAGGFDGSNGAGGAQSFGGSQGAGSQGFGSSQSNGSQNFGGSQSSRGGSRGGWNSGSGKNSGNDGFMEIPDGFEDDLPFN